MPRITVDQLKQIAKNYKNQYKVVAIRTQELPFNLGVIDHKSHKWDNGCETTSFINGISATNINTRSLKAIKMHSSEHDLKSGYYFGNYQAIICGNSYKYGEDAGEVIIKDAVCVKIL